MATIAGLWLETRKGFCSSAPVLRPSARATVAMALLTACAGPASEAPRVEQPAQPATTASAAASTPVEPTAPEPAAAPVTQPTPAEAMATDTRAPEPPSVAALPVGNGKPVPGILQGEMRMSRGLPPDVVRRIAR